MRTDTSSKGHLAILIASLIFGLNIPISKAVLAQGAITPFSLSLLRFCGGAVLFWIASLAMPKEKVSLRDLGLMFLASLLGIQFNQGFFVMGLAYTSSVNASIMATLTPILTMLLAALFLREPITWLKGLGVAIGAYGAWLLILGNGHLHGATQGDIKGDMFIVLSGISYASYLTLFKPLVSRYSPVTLMKWMFLFAAICCTPIGYKQLVSIDVAQLPATVWLSVSYVVIMASFLAYMLIPVGQKVLRPTVLSMYNYLQPIVASLVAVALGLEAFGWHKAAAAALVFTGVWVVSRSKSKAQVDAEKAAKSADC